MSSLKIYDLNYCETVKEEIVISGGLNFSTSLPSRHLCWFRFPSIEPLNQSDLDDFEQTEITTNTNSTITRLTNPTTGQFGYQITSKDGTSNNIVLFGSNSKQSFSMAVS